MNLYEKLYEIQQEIRVPKKHNNTFGDFKYRKVEDIYDAFKKLEEKYKVMLMFDSDMESTPNGNYIVAIAILADLESDAVIRAKSKVKEPLQAKPKMDESQTSGSAMTYARKYVLNGLLLLDDNIDLDSNEAVDDGTPASDAQINTINGLCEKHNGDIKYFCKKMKIKGSPTAKQAGLILNFFKTYFGDE